MPTAYISEASYAGTPSTDFVEVAVTAGTDVSSWSVYYYNQSGYWLYTVSFPAPTTTMAGRDIYLFTNTTSINASIGIVDGTGTTQQFISFYDPPVTTLDGALAGQTPTYAGVTAASGQSIQSDDGGTSYYIQSVPNEGTIPCFAPGMMVECSDGARRVDELMAGDLVVTLDRGPQPIVWVSRRDHAFDREDFSDRPILIPAGQFGAARDLIVSPQHRVLLPTAGTKSTPGVLVPAKALVGMGGIRQMCGRPHLVWHHFALANHELVRVNGVWTESLLLGPMVINGLPRRQRLALRAIFPRARSGHLNGPPARLCLTVQQTRGLLHKSTMDPRQTSTEFTMARGS